MEIFLLIIIILMVGYLILTGDKIYFWRNSAKELLIDTSILIDGRLLSVAKTGFLAHKILIPRSVVGELQLLADGGNDDKRVRARYGLDVISALQATEKLDVEILQDGVSASEGVDNRLIKLAKERGAMICTADFNLNKVAKVEGIEVLNINELAQSVRANYLPGERMMLELTSKGNEKNQGVGHLPDGTMVVVENGERLVNTMAEVEFIRVLQTAAGKMMFAQVVDSKKIQTATNPTKAKSSGRKPAAKTPTVKSKPASKDSKQKSSRADQPKKSNTSSARPKTNRRRRTPEDSLVELANR